MILLSINSACDFEPSGVIYNYIHSLALEGRNSEETANLERQQPEHPYPFVERDSDLGSSGY